MAFQSMRLVVGGFLPGSIPAAYLVGRRLRGIGLRRLFP